MGDGFLLHGSMIDPARRTKEPFRGEFGEGQTFLRLPLVSVIVINFNYGRFLRATVESVFGQTYPNVECIVVDNASTDESGAVLQAIEARIRRCEDHPPGRKQRPNPGGAGRIGRIELGLMSSFSTPTIFSFPIASRLISSSICRCAFTWDLPPATCSSFPAIRWFLEPNTLSTG